jgi:hypothetical protein
MKKRVLTVAAAVLMYMVVMAGVAFAWMTSQQAQAACGEGKHVLLTATFTNTEPPGSKNSMDVTALGQTKTAAPGDTVTFGPKDLGPAPQPGGSVRFDLVWTDGHRGKDSRTAPYGPVNGCSNPSLTVQVHVSVSAKALAAVDVSAKAGMNRPGFFETRDACITVLPVTASAAATATATAQAQANGLATATYDPDNGTDPTTKTATDSASASDSTTASGSASDGAIFRLVQGKRSRIIRLYEGRRLIATIRLSANQRNFMCDP